MTDLLPLIPYLLTGLTWATLKLASPKRLALLRIPGVAVHELAHYLTAAATGSNPSALRIPWKTDDAGNLVYGEVEFEPGWGSASLVALAPLFLTPWVVAFSMQAGILGAIGAGSILAHGFPSKTDFLVALRYPLSWPLAALGVYASFTGWVALWLPA